MCGWWTIVDADAAEPAQEDCVGPCGRQLRKCRGQRYGTQGQKVCQRCYDDQRRGTPSVRTPTKATALARTPQKKAVAPPGKGHSLPASGGIVELP